jgi:predicted metal-dependent hydrolase
MNPPNPIKIRRQNRKSLLMKQTSSGITVFIPRWLAKDDPQVQAFIADGLTKLAPLISSEPRVQQTTIEELLAMVEGWATRIGVQPKRVRVRTMYSRWGSCSSKGNINLNRALCYLPRHLAEYVVCHELVHLRIFNHSRAFKETMSQYLPDWKARQQELKDHHP